MAAQKKSTAVSKTEKASIITAPEGARIQELIQENLGGQLDASALDRVKIPSGGIPSWVVPTLEGEDMQKTIEGVIVFHQMQNVFWKESIDQGGAGNPPDCAARDGLVGIGDPGGDCVKCPYNQFGSGEDGRGKACKNQRVLYLLQPGKILPLAIALPPTSIKSTKTYFMRLTTNAVMYYNVVSTLSLEKLKNPDGIEYSVCKITTKQALPAADQKSIQNYRMAIVPALQQIVIEADATQS